MRVPKEKLNKIATIEEYGISLFQSVKNKMRFQISWKKSKAGCKYNYGRKRFNASSVQEALANAPIVAGLAPKMMEVLFTLVMAFNLAFAASNRKPGSRSAQDWEQSVRAFIIWLEKRDSSVKFWHLLTRDIIKEYLSCFDGKSDTYRRLKLQPLIQTDRFMNREHGFARITEQLGIGNKLKRPVPAVYIQDVTPFLNFLKEKFPYLEACCALQGLCGLQFLEAVRLTWDKVDLVNGLIEISGEVKNDYRTRVIPIADRALDALKRANQERKIINVQGGDYVCCTKMGCAAANTPKKYGRLIKQAMLEWNPKIDWQPKDLRKALTTYGTLHGLGGDLLEMYVGHKVRSVTGMHYVPSLKTISLGQREQLGRVMQQFHIHIVEPINREVAGNKREQFLNFFERGNAVVDGQVQNSKCESKLSV